MFFLARCDLVPKIYENDNIEKTKGTLVPWREYREYKIRINNIIQWKLLDFNFLIFEIHHNNYFSSLFHSLVSYVVT